MSDVSLQKSAIEAGANSTHNQRAKKRVSLTRNVVESSTGRKLAAACIAVLLLAYIVTVSIDGHSRILTFGFVGGTIGAISALYVLIGFHLNPKEFKSSLQLLYWRSICDLGLAIRFLAAPGFNQAMCQKFVCTLEDLKKHGHSEACQVSSAILEFFEISSEAWFLMIGLDLYFSINYPFFPLKTRMKYYHLFTWTFTICYTIPTIVVPQLHGPWYVADDLDQDSVCWISIQKFGDEIVNYRPFVMFYIPLITIYVACSVFLYLAYRRLKNGIPKTVLNRMRILVLNLINIALYALYWGLLLLFYGLANIFRKDPSSSLYFFELLIFMLSAKSFSSVLVWITAKSLKFKGSEEGDDEDDDLNTTLRREVLYSATKGIRCCTRQSARDTVDHRIEIRIDEKETEDSMAVTNTLTKTFFLKLIFGLKTQELNAIINEQQAKRAESSKVEVTEDNESSTHIANVARRSTFSKAMNTRLSVSKASRQSIEESQNDDDYEVLNTTNSGFSDSIWDGLYMHLFEKEDKVIFTEFMPQAFRKVRLSAGISDADYIKSFSSTIKERVAEGGASGAFFFLLFGRVVHRKIMYGGRKCKHPADS